MEFHRLRMIAGVAVVVAMIGAVSVSAAPILHMSYTYDGSYESFDPETYVFGDPTEYLLTDPSVMLEEDDVHLFSVYFALLGTTASPDQSLAGILFDVKLAGTGGLIPYTSDTWGGGEGGDEPDGIPEGYYTSMTGGLQYDPPPAGGTLPLKDVIKTNADQGFTPEDTDLQRILVQTEGQAYAHGRDPGELVSPWGSPLLLGTFMLKWDGETFGEATVGLQLAASAPADPWSYFEGTTTTVIPDPTNTFVIDTEDMEVNIIPEPASIALAGLALVGLLGLIRRR